MKKCESINESCSAEDKRSPEEQIRYLKRELRDANARVNEAQEELNKKTIQTHALMDIIVDLRRYTKELEHTAKFDAKRMDDYRTAIHEIYCECEGVISAYRDLPSEETVISEREYNLANVIYEIVKRF